MKNMNKKIIIYFIFIISIIINSIFAYYFFLGTKTKNSIISDENYPLLSKRIFTQNPNDIILNFVPLRKAVKEYVSKYNSEVGVYFEYLPSGISIGVNDREEIKLASLSKVPLVMSIFKKIEKGEIKLDDVVYLRKEDLDKKFGNLWQRGEGAKLSVKELIEYSLIDSDNTAYHSLFNKLTAEEVVDVYSNLEIEVDSKETDPIVSPKSYSSIFRSLYLSSYLSEKNSNYILEILTRTKFKDKIPAGVPSDIKVAHKIGVFSRADNPDNVYTDCGIVYVPERPYVLCIFVKKSDDLAKKHMAYLSYMIYSYITIIRGGNSAD